MNSFDACHELFSSMEALQKESRIMMVKNDNAPCDFGASYANCDLTRIVWMYMKGFIKGKTTMVTVDLPNKYVNLHPGMRLKSWRRTITTETLVFKTQPKIKNLRSVLGQFIGVGMKV
jgi:hypothetical protein